MKTKRIKPAVVVIAYNREKSLSRLLNSLKRAVYAYEDITLIISIDYWVKENPCYAIADSFEWSHGEKKVYKHAINLGLRKHVMKCGDLSNEYEAVILLEDDLVVSPQFYNYAVEACSFYYDKDEVVGIGLFSHHLNGYAQLPFYPYRNEYDTYYEKWVISWGECFCKNQWNAFRNWYDKRNKKLEYKDMIPHEIANWPDSSWGKYMVYYLEESGKYFVSPYEAYSTNFCEMGTHVKKSDCTQQIPMRYGKRTYHFADLITSVKYNLFFENMDETYFKSLLGIKGALKMDLYGLCQNYEGFDYCISIKELPYKVVKSFAMEMKPIELNIIEGIEGSDIYLYDMKVAETRKSNKRKLYYDLYKYYYPSLSYRRLVGYLYEKTIDKIKERNDRKGYEQ